MKSIDFADAEAVEGRRRYYCVAGDHSLFIGRRPCARSVYKDAVVRRYVVKLGRQAVAREVVKGGEVQPFDKKRN